MKTSTTKQLQPETAEPKANNQAAIGSILQRYKKDGHSESVIQRNPRVKLGQDLFNHFGTGNTLAKGIFKGMNHMMYRNNVPLTPQHDLVLRQKLITENAGLWDTLKAENPYVLASQGSGHLYNLGKEFHKRVVYPFTQ